MNFRYLSQARCPSWMDFLTLGLMSLAAPLIAALIHSAFVFYSGIRFYKAEIWRLSEHTDFWSILAWVGGLSVPGLITFLILLPFRKDTLLHWILWICCIILWTGALFITEPAAFK
jgi:hypothetical protein